MAFAFLSLSLRDPDLYATIAFWLHAGREAWSGLLLGALVILLAYQQWRLYEFRQQAVKREELFRIVAENAADMIALVDVKGRRLYNSPAYKKILGYSADELGKTSAFEQIHPDDRFKVLDAAREARNTGVGKKLEYRIRHKDGQWRVLESTASTIKNERGEVEKLVIVNRDVTDRKKTEEQLEHNSFHDGLTGLPNRRLFLDRLEHAFLRAQRSPKFQYAILFVDVDDFKAINDAIGPTAGDQIIAEVGRRLSACLRDQDTVARPQGALPMGDALLSRLGGDEFTVLLEDIEDPSDALRVAERIQAAVAAPFHAAGREVQASASIGIALSTAAHDQAEDLLQHADIAMRRAKAYGGSRREVFDEGMHARAVSRLKLEADLRAAIDQGQFQLCYQPIVSLSTKHITGFEALVRWQHPERGLISPQNFIDVAEKMGITIPLGKWVIRQACRQAYTWQSKYPSLGSLSMTVNLSAKQFVHPHLVQEIQRAIQEIGTEPCTLQLEVGENIATANPKLTLEVFSQLKRLGVRVGIGDFGAGHSSLSCLRRWPIDELKIDRPLVRSMTSDRCSSDVIQLAVLVARSLKLRVVAAGIETAVELKHLESLGCEFGQGYFLSHPLESERAEQLLHQQSRGWMSAHTSS
jgi:PAS domain S-box-containing protein